MFNTYSPWRELSLQPHLTLEWEEFDDDRLGEYDHGRLLIRLDPRMPRRQARSVLSHELRHAEYGDVVTDCARRELRQEQRADEEAAAIMIHIDDLARAAVLHNQHPSATAVELGVSDEQLQVRLHHLRPVERGILKRAVANILVP